MDKHPPDRNQTPMEQFMDALIEEAHQAEEACAVQIVFAPGARMQAGLLTAHPIEGLYQLGSGGRAQVDDPEMMGVRAGDAVHLNFVFPAEAVLQVITMTKIDNRIVQPVGH